MVCWVLSVVMLVGYCSSWWNNCSVLFSGVFAFRSVIVCCHVEEYVDVVWCCAVRVCSVGPLDCQYCCSL